MTKQSLSQERLDEEKINQANIAAQFVKNGQVIAYPVEFCFGLGCDITNQKAVDRILWLKQRDVSKGLIIIADTIEKLLPFIDVSDAEIDKMNASWPAPLTWIVKKSSKLPAWISGDFNTIAIRIPNHPIARAICASAKMAMVSTSCNPSGFPAANSAAEVSGYFHDQLDYIVDSEISMPNNADKASTIRDLATDKIIRA